MIVARLMGGLGNQMFQYAAAKRLAVKRDAELRIDKTWYEKQDPNAPALREYELSCFTLEPNFISAKELKKLLPEGSEKGLLGGLLSRSTDSAQPKLTKLIEKAHNFDPAIITAPDNTLLEGYWQTERYFEDVADEIKKGFEFATPQDAKNGAVSAQIKASMAVSLHVRRGDYVSNAQANAFHGTSTLDYYKIAMGKIIKKVPNATFFVFSDEPEWCKENLHFDQPTVYVDSNPPDKGFEDLRLMQQCQHHILANSSFSWWGAWLGLNPDRIVIAPKRWFNDSSINTEDVIPKRWETV